MRRKKLTSISSQTRRSVWSIAVLLVIPVIIGLVMAAVSVAVIFLMGRTYRYEMPALEELKTPEDYSVILEQEEEYVVETGRTLENGTFSVTVAPKARGRAFLTVDSRKGVLYGCSLYVHAFGLITADGFFGKSRGGIVLPIMITLFLGLLLYCRIQKYRKGVRDRLRPEGRPAGEGV